MMSAWSIRTQEETRAYLGVDLVSAWNNGNVFADAFEITMSVGNILVDDMEGGVERDDATWALDSVRHEDRRTFPGQSCPTH